MPNVAAETYRLEVRRVIPVARERVFQAWTTRDQLERFMTPGRLDAAVVTCDPRVGGRFTIDMHGEKGEVWHHEGEYLEVTPPSRLKFTWVSKGTEQLATVVTIDFLDREGKTELVLVHEGLPTAKGRDGHTEGWTAILAQVQRTLE